MLFKWVLIHFLKHTELSKPNVSNIMKKMSAQNVLPGIVAMAAGYTINTKPGPSVATAWMLWPDECAMYPNTEKITNPAQKLVAELIKLVNSASLNESFWRKYIFITNRFGIKKYNSLTYRHYYGIYCKRHMQEEHQNQGPVRRTLVLQHRPKLLHFE